MKIKTIDGNEACSLSSYLFTELAGIYPITPSSPMAEHIDKWSSLGKTNLFNQKVKVVQMQSEAGASGLVHGSLRNGVLTSTYTASQGLLLMIPNMYKMAGEMLPCVMHVAARSLSTHALSILGDHQDIYATRMTGFIMMASSSVQDCNYLSAIAHLTAIKSSLPVLHFFDGFRTSHELSKINVLEEDDVKDLIDIDALNKFREKGLNTNNPKIYGTNQNDDIYFQITESRNKFYNEASDIVNEYMEKINKITNSNYKPFNYYGSKTAKNIIVAMGSVCDTIKEVVDELDNVGLIEVHLYRPFSVKYLLNVLPETVSKIAVLDRTKEFGGREPLYLDICEALKDKDIEIVGGRYGLSSKDTDPSQIKAVFDMLDNNIQDNFTIGIVDDVTNLSLPKNDFKIKKNSEMLIYGYGSDGMVSASKSLLKIYSDKYYVQGYFQYDSKKSGGVTKCHLRFGNNPIKEPYYVKNPKLIAVTKDTYMNNFEILNELEENGIFILNTTNPNIEEYLSDSVKKQIVTKNIKFYTINAFELARRVGLGNKISTIIEACILHLSNVIDSDIAINKLKEEIRLRFNTIKPEVVEPNLLAIDEAISNLKEVKISGEFKESKININNVYEAMFHRMGDNLKVSDFKDMEDGKMDINTSSKEKRMISDIVPSWINSNCVKCNMCSLICPHGVIRPFKLSDEEYEQAPSYIKERCVDNYILAISVKDCTGCGLCMKTCPSKALISQKLFDKLEEQKVYDYLEQNITCKEENVFNIKNSQFREPKLQFSGACAGCGQPAYIKLLTQLFDNVIISNATGCSSIYGASAPSMPYKIPWASSLFEDNAEYGFGMIMSNQVMKDKIKDIFSKYDEPLFKKWLENPSDYNITKEVYDNIDYDKYPILKPIKDYIIKRNIWIVGGDGWAYDIGFSGIDHVLASGENVKILVLDTQVYSNTGGQASKATPKGSVALFASSGKMTAKKDLAKMMMSYSNVYVAQVSLAANPMQTIKAFKEANEYNGPAIIIAYAPCISHGIKGGMVNSLDMEKEAVNCGYFPLFRNNPLTKFSLDSKANFDLYEDFLLKQTRYHVLTKVNEEGLELLKQNKQNAIDRYNYYSSL